MKNGAVIARVVTCALAMLVIQSCRTSHVSCVGFMANPEYLNAPDYKSIAQYFDRESGEPQGHQKDIESECWFQTWAESQAVANQQTMEACNDSLEELGRFEEWNCHLVVEGDQITFAERARLTQNGELSSNAKRRGDSKVLKTKRVSKSPAQPRSGSKTSPPGRKKKG